MKHYRVYTTIKTLCIYDVTAEDEEEAKDKALNGGADEVDCSGDILDEEIVEVEEDDEWED